MRVINAPMTGVITVSGYGYHEMVASELLPPGRFHMIYNSVAIARADLGLACGEEFRRRHLIPPDRRVVMQVSGLISDKGVEDLLAAAREVIAAEPNTDFVLVGDGAHRQNFESLACDLGIASHLTFTGVVLDPLADGVYAASDVVCLMSRREALPYVNAEAMASRKPLVCTRVGGIPEIVQDGVTGFLVERRDSAAMAAKILELLRDPLLRHRMGEAGRQVVAEKFNLKTNVAQLIALYGI